MRTNKLQRFNSLVAIVVVAAAHLFSSSPADAKEPGDLYEWPVAGSNPPMTLRLRFCPAGKLESGKPSASETATTVPPTVINEFYAGETEISIEQFKAVLGDQALAEMKRRAAKQKANNPVLLRVLEESKNKPIFFASVEDGIKFCRRLDEEIDRQWDQSPTPAIESKRFRLPSYHEWQYACRAAIRPDEVAASPHFNRWISIEQLDVGTQQKAKEIWAKFGRPRDFLGTQNDVFDIAFARDADPAKLADILQEYMHKCFYTPLRNAAGLGMIMECGRTTANRWKIYDCHDNVTEWVIWTDDPRKTWSDLAGGDGLKTAAAKPIYFLSGGCFADSFLRPGELAKFTVWGGPKLEDGKPAPFACDDEVIEDLFPGFRIIVERYLADNWLFALRRAIYRNDQFAEDAGKSLEDADRLVHEIAPGDETAIPTLQFYYALLNYSRSKEEKSVNQLEATRLRLIHRAKNTSKRLDALFGNEGTQGNKEKIEGPSDDDQFFELFAALARSNLQQH